MNVNVPANDLTGNKYDVFGIVIASAFVIIVIYASFVRSWWMQAKKKRGKVLS